MTNPMPDDADLSLPAIVTMVAEFLAELDLHQVTVVCNDWGGEHLITSPGGSERAANLVLVSCENSDNDPPEGQAAPPRSAAGPPRAAIRSTSALCAVRSIRSGRRTCSCQESCTADAAWAFATSDVGNVTGVSLGDHVIRQPTSHQ